MTSNDRSDLTDHHRVSEHCPVPVSFLRSLNTDVVILNGSGKIEGFHLTESSHLSASLDDTSESLLGTSYLNWIQPTVNGSLDDLEKRLVAVCRGEQPSFEIDCRLSVNGSVVRVRLSAEAFSADGTRYVTVTHSFPSFAGDSGSRQVRLGIDQGTFSADGASSRVQLLRALHESTRDLMAAETPKDVAETATKIVDKYFKFSTVGFRMVENGKLVMVASDDTDPRTEGREPPAYDIGETFVGETFQDGEARVFSDLERVSRDSSFDYSPMKSAMLLPVGDYGIIAMASDEPDDFDEADLELGRQFAASVEAAMRRAYREEKLRERELELRETSVDQNYLLSILDALPAGLLITDPGGEISTTNRTLRRMLGYDEETLQGESAALIFPDDGETTEERFETLRYTDGPMFEETEFVSRNGEEIPVFLTAHELEPIHKDDTEIIFVGIDITELKLKNQQLRESQRRLSLALNAASAGVWESEIGSRKEYWDENTRRLFGLEPDESVAETDLFWEFVHPDDVEGLKEATQEAIETRGGLEREFRIVTKEGEVRWMLSRAEVQTNLAGDPESLIGVTVDITDRKEAENALKRALDEKETLLREIHHRVKNNMQIIQSLLSMQQRNLDADLPKRAFQESIDRVNTMAMVHENLYQSEDLANVNFERYLRTLCDNLLSTHGATDSITLNLEVSVRNLGLDKCIACGLIVNELVTNALEHAFPSQEGGRIIVRFGTDGDRVELIVDDNGRGLDDNFTPEESGGTGLDIVESLAEYELGGTVNYDYSEGFRVTVRFSR